ncbi:MAG: hypothetical protein ACXW15_09095 [Acidimicrobiia bacterium]
MDLVRVALGGLCDPGDSGRTLRAKKEIDAATNEMEGRSLAVAAIVAGGVGLGTAIFVLIVLLTAPPS